MLAIFLPDVVLIFLPDVASLNFLPDVLPDFFFFYLNFFTYFMTMFPSLYCAQSSNEVKTIKMPAHANIL